MRAICASIAAEGGETLLALDERTYVAQPGMMLISDETGLESLAGIMGGEASGVTAETTAVFLESAWWDPVTVAMTGRALKITSDARYRFERGVDPEHTLPGLEAATRMVLNLCGGEASDLVQDGAPVDWRRSYPLDTGRVQSLVGMEIAPETQRATLAALGFALDGDDASPPPWRPDVRGSADLVEEVARVASLTRLKARPLPRQDAGVPAPVLSPAQQRERLARRTAAALGYSECVTYSFIDAAAAALFGGGDAATRLENPISTDMSHMRPSLLPGLLRAAARNQARGFSDLALFELGPVWHGGEPENQGSELAGILIGRTAPKDVHGSGRPVDLYDAKSDAEALLAALGAPDKAQILREGPSWWHPGRHGRICLGPKKVLGIFGELHPRVLAALDVKGPAVAFTLWPGEVPMPKSATSSRGALALSDLQVVERDFAFVLDGKVEAANVVNAAAGADRALIESVRVFDEFTGPSLVEGKKSLAITVRLQPREATLTEAEIDAIATRIVDKVGRATGGVLRR